MEWDRMNRTPKLLDLFCKAGGASMGYEMAGFDVVGVDIKKQKRYPFKFIQADALAIMADKEFLSNFDVIAASPPCQTHSITQHLRDAQGNSTTKLDLIPETRQALQNWGGKYIIENVPGAPLINPVVMCGSSFGLKVRRHRHFESNLSLTSLKCDHKGQGRPVGVYGAMNDHPKGIDRTTGKMVYGGRTATSIDEAREAMGINWMIWGELVEAIPPAYTEHLGKQAISQL
jgi:DNA (cytosine-5)-methyltransferase 1